MTRLLESCLALLCLSSLFLCHISFSAPVLPANQKHVLFFVPDYPGSPFWDTSMAFAKSCAHAVDMKLEIVRIPRDRWRYRESETIANTLKSYTEMPDLLISTLLLGGETKVLDLVKKYDVPFISINSHITENRFKQLGQPRKQHPNWLAHMAPNDVLAGYELAKQLIAVSRSKKCPKKQCQVNILGITGLTYTLPSQQRTSGLRQAVSEDGNAKLVGVFPGDWNRNITAEKFPSFIKRFNAVDIVWSASYSMASAVIDYQKEHKLLFETGAIDWAPDALAAVNNGDLSVSVGGHYMEAGWAILLHADYLAGFDFAQQLGSIINTPLSAISQNYEKESQYLANPQWNKKILRQFTRSFNPSWREYHLNALSFVQAHIQGGF